MHGIVQASLLKARQQEGREARHAREVGLAWRQSVGAEQRALEGFGRFELREVFDRRAAIDHDIDLPAIGCCAARLDAMAARGEQSEERLRLEGGCHPQEAAWDDDGESAEDRLEGIDARREHRADVDRVQPLRGRDRWLGHRAHVIERERDNASHGGVMSDFSAGPTAFFAQDHRSCDEQWAAFEAAHAAGDAARASAAWVAFDRRFRAHLTMEEDVLFPALEQATGMQGGPTHVMRLEHQQMRGLLDQMGEAAAQGDFAGVADDGDTLLMLIQQHNMKEENVLYPMADRALGAKWAGLVPRLEPLYRASR